ncbi:hypothetical protein [Psychrobacter urativorans]|uniref:hypothetical protein n=1 Tax=Psychrobacter urativorans TaxID=45610 RepID=UPI001917F962|nr:hypothetical protein [Psychrobacter urativorans]
MKKTALNTSLRTALWAVFAVTLGVSVSACSSDKEAESESGEVMAVDRVDAAAELARKNGPEAEDMEFPETAPMAADADTETTVTAEDDTVATDMPEANDNTATDIPVTDTAEKADEEMDTADAEPTVSQ